MEPDATLAGDARELGDRIDAPQVHVAGTADDGHLRAAGRRVFVERGLQSIEVDGAVPIERNFAQAAAAQAQHAQRPADDVMRLGRAVDGGFDQPVVAVARGMQSEPLSGMLPRSAEADQVCGRAAGGERSGKARGKAQQSDQPAHREVVDEVAGRGPPSLRDRNGLCQVGGRGNVGRHRRHPAAEARVAGSKAVGDHQVRQLGENGISSDARDGKRPVERGPPVRTRSRRVGPFEPHEALQRREHGGDGAAQVIGGGAVAAGAHAAAAGIWKPGVERDKLSSSGVISVATPSNSGVDR